MFIRRGAKYAGFGATGAVLAAALTLVPSAAHAAQPSPDDAAVGWLTKQLKSNGLVDGDVSTTIDLGTALAETGGDEATIARIKAAVDANVADYVIGDGTDGVNASQAAVFYEAIDEDPTTVDGDLIAKIEAATDDDTGMTHAQYGYEGAWSQGLAVRALEGADSTEAPQALDFLLGLQCSDGGWGGLDCSSAPSDPDDTADALLALIPLQGSDADSDAVDTAIASGIDWLTTNQKTDGGFDPGWGENASSTGLAAQALDLGNETGAAEKAAVFLRRLQVAGTPCDGKLSGDGGAVAYSSDKITAAKTDGIAGDPGAKYDWYAPAVQAFPSLYLAPDASASLGIATSAWVKAGSTAKVTAQGLAAGQRGCVSLAGKQINVVGGATATGSVKLAAKTKAYTAILRVLGGSATKKVVALAPKRLKVTRSRAVVAKGGKEKVTVTGLFAGEPVSIKYAGKTVAKGVASSSGRFTRTVKVGRKAGKKSVSVTGRFTTRKGSAAFRVR